MRHLVSKALFSAFWVAFITGLVCVAQQPTASSSPNPCPQTNESDRAACLLQQLKRSNDQLEQLLKTTNSAVLAAQDAQTAAERAQTGAVGAQQKATEAQQKATEAQQGATSAFFQTVGTQGDTTAVQKSVASTAAKAAELVKRAQRDIPVPAGGVTPGSRDNTQLLQDHVPCLETPDRLYFLRTGIPVNPPDPAQKISQQVGDLAKSSSNPRDTKILQSYSSKLSASNWRGLTPAQVRQNADKDLSAAVAEALPDATPEEKATATAQVAQQVAPAVAQAVTEPTFKRPGDIGCSMSIMPWAESSKVFGREVADAYLAVQVDVRNMDGDHEFLLHDAEFAVDAYGAQLSRFQVGHEKQIVRGVSVWGENYGRHAVNIHIVEGVGIIMGAVVGLPQPPIQNLVNATGAYQAGLIPMVNKIFPSLSTNNLNNLNDFAFSATANSRIVVPKGGSVPFVLFVPVEPLQQACWLQEGYDFQKDDGFTTACNNVCTKDECKQGKPAWHSHKSSYDNLTEIRFKYWTPIQLQALQKHSYITIAGAHFKELAAQPTLKGVICAAETDQSGAYRIASLGTKPLVCTLTGADLDTMPTLRMRPPNDTTDADAVDATVSVSGDSSTATATFATAQVKNITKPLYNLFSLDKSGKEADLKQTLKFLPAPQMTPIASPPTIGNFRTTPSLPLSGANLQQVSQVLLKDPSGAVVATMNMQSVSSDGTRLTPMNVGAADLAHLQASTKYEIWFVLSDGSQTQFDTGQSITFGQ